MQDAACNSLGTAPSAAQAPDDAVEGPPRLLVHNLFALEAYHVAQARETCDILRLREVLPYTASADLCLANHAMQAT